MVFRRRLPWHVYGLTLASPLLCAVAMFLEPRADPVGSNILVDVPADRVRDTPLILSLEIPEKDHTPARRRQLGAVAYLVVVVGLGDDIKCLDKLGLLVSRVTADGTAQLKPVYEHPYGHNYLESCRHYNALQIEGKPEERVLLAVNGLSSNLPQYGRLLVIKHWERA